MERSEARTTALIATSYAVAGRNVHGGVIPSRKDGEESPAYDR